MIKEITFLSIIGLMSFIYNLFIYRYMIMMIGENIYNHIIIFIIIIVQIDNISLYNDLKNNNNDKTNDKTNDKYMRIIMNQMTYIIRQNNEYKKMYEVNKNKYKSHKSFTNKSCNDLCKYIKNDY